MRKSGLELPAADGHLSLVIGPRLATCEDIIEAGLQTFYDVGQALAHIRDAELYRAGYVTFQAYLRERWGITFNHANHLIAGADVVRSMGELEIPPSSFGVAEELLPLPTRLRTEVWHQALATTKRTTNGKPNPTADEVQHLVEAKLAGVADRPSSKTVASFLSDDEELVLRRVRGGEAVVTNFRKQAELIAQADAEGLFVRVDRNSRWGNPFVLDDDGSRSEVVDAYRDYYLPHKPSLLAKLGDLEGKLLGCWCAPDRCHADILASHVNARRKAS